MQLKFIIMFIGGLIISTNLSAVEAGNNLNNSHLHQLKNIHHYNNIFDDYSSGSIPYESYKK